jgi:hypothetical protein
MSSPDHLLAIYLNDHLAGATLGVELARRLRASNRDDDALAEPLIDVCAEVEADRETLRRLMRQLGVRRDPLKPAAAWLAEKLGRLKLNGRLTGYSPLSRLVELEMLSIGIAGKMQLWEVLERTLGESVPGFDFYRLAERAAGQRERARELHSIAAARALPPR